MKIMTDGADSPIYIILRDIRRMYGKQQKLCLRDSADDARVQRVKNTEEIKDLYVT
jgi:hypothetical protein